MVKADTDLELTIMVEDMVPDFLVMQGAPTTLQLQPSHL